MAVRDAQPPIRWIPSPWLFFRLRRRTDNTSFRRRLPNSQESGSQPFNAFVKGPSSQFNADQINGNIDYIFGPKDRLAGKYYFQRDPTSIPFAVRQVLGFPQTMRAGSQLFSLDNTTIFTSNATWENRYGFVREVADATTAQSLKPSDVNLNLLGSTFFPGITIPNAA